jgi:predicted O-methyltransferase YrrM
MPIAAPTAPTRSSPHRLSSHPVCRGDFAALVFSGSSAKLGELPGEATALALYKFALHDPRPDIHDSFAQSPGMPLPLWPQDRIQPTDAVCFVLSDRGHPAVHTLHSCGAVEHEHFVIAEELLADDEAARNDNGLADFVRSLPAPKARQRIAVLGYGHQGAALASRLVEEFEIAPANILIHDENEQCRARAVADNFHVVNEDEIIESASAVVYSPLAHFQRLQRTFDAARVRGLPIFDNRCQPSGLHQFCRVNRAKLDGAAARALRIHKDIVSAKPHRLALNCTVIREDWRRLNGVEVPHMHGGHQFSLHTAADQFDLLGPCPADPLSQQTYVAAEQSFISLRNRADLGFFAARDLCLRLWPQATREVFPAQHVMDLGATAVERLLLAHLHGRELVSTMQTPAQRVVLAVAAHHYASDRDIIEIGSAFGGSALLMTAATNTSARPIHSIDPEASTRDIMRFAFAREGFLCRLHQIISPSDQAVSRLTHFRGRAGLVFIDGLHTQVAVASDIDLYSPLVAPGGALALHDVVPQLYSVMKVVIGRLLDDRRFEPKCLVDGLMLFERRHEAA